MRRRLRAERGGAYALCEIHARCSAGVVLISFKEVDDRQEPAKLPRNDPKRAENRRLDLQHELLLRDSGAHRWRNEGLRLGKDV